MNTARFLNRLLNSLSGSEGLGGRKLIVEKAGALTDVRAMIAVVGVDASPIVLWYNPRQTAEERVEALAWAVGHIALGHLKDPKGGLFTLTVATLKDHLPNLSLTDDWFLRKSRRDLSLKAFLWGAMFLVDSKRYRELRTDNSPREVREILSRELMVPIRLIRLWEKCQRLSPTSLEQVVGRPREWAKGVLAKPRETQTTKG